jgi:hypothetical protein
MHNPLTTVKLEGVLKDMFSNLEKAVHNLGEEELKKNK